MDCLNVQGPKIDEPTLLGSSPPPRAQRRSGRFLKASIFALAILYIVLLGLFIWVAVEVQDNKNDLNSLKASLVANPTSQYVNTASATSNGNATLSAVSTAYPAVFLSNSASAQPGYGFAGSLYRGSGYWATQPSLQPARSSFAALNLNETIYLLGGRDGSNNRLTSVLTYDPIRNLTGNATALPSSRSQFAAGSPDNVTIIVVGGYSSPVNESGNVPEKCSLVYNSSAGSWANGACLQAARGATCGAVVAGKFFVVTGVGSGGSLLSSIEVYHPSNNSWTTFASLPSGRSDVGCAASGNDIIIAGGANATSVLSEVWAVNSDRGNMTRLADMLYPRTGLQLVALPDGDVLAAGGASRASNALIALHEVERLSRRSNQWVEKAPLSTQRTAFGAAFADDGVFALGGQTYCNGTRAADCTSQPLDSVEVFYDSDHPDVFIHVQSPGAATNGPAPNSSQVLLLTTTAAINGYSKAGSLYRGSGYWAQGLDLPQALSDLNVVGYGDAAFIVGGLDIDTTTASNALYKYDPAAQQYYNMSNLPEPRTRGGADVIGDTLYYVGGFSSGNDSAEPVDTMLAYNITSNTWQQSSARLSAPRSDLCVAAVNGTLYAAGGYSANYNETLNIVEKYDPNTRAWTPVTSMPTPRGDVMCAAMNGLFVVVGGFYDPTGQFLPASFRTEVEAYNPATEEWISLDPLPAARGDAAITVVPSRFGDRLVVTGGESQLDNERTGIATHQVQEYSSALDEWTLKAPMISPRFRHDAAYSGGGVLLFGGASSSICDADGSGLEVCTLRPIAAVEQFFDTDNPDVFVYVSA